MFLVSMAQENDEMAQASLVTSRNYSSDERYQYDTFTTGLILQDMAFKRFDPGPGDMVPTFDLPVVGGERFRSVELGGRPVLMVFGSLTCPVTESSGPVLNKLHQAFGDRIRFVVVNTREAHPGELIPQPKTFPEKERHAERLKKHHDFDFEVAVDDLDGTLHRALGPKPNSAYILSPEGRILFRAHWANDAGGLKWAIARVIAGRAIGKGKSSAMLWPLLKAIGHLPGVVRSGGRKVAHDVWRAVPPFGVMAGASKLFPFLPKDYRGVAATLLLSGLAAGTVSYFTTAF
jgi:thiol-disulfide isomerase/thioredoxin